MRLRLLGLAAVLAALLPSAVALGSLPAGEPTVGVDRLAAASAPLSVVRGIATFDAAPTALDVAALKGHGITAVQPMKNLPLALVRGTVQSMESAVSLGAANDIYPDDPVELLDTASSDATSGAGTSSLLIDLIAAAAHPGTYTFQVSGQRAVSDPDTFDSEALLGRVVVLQVAQART